MSAREFLSLILPATGLKTCCTILRNRGEKKGRITHRWTASTDQLADLIFAEDAWTHDAEDLELSVYHGCAAFKTQARQQVEALGASSLWMDVDAGEGKPYADKYAAAEALAEFTRSSGLPRPVVVGSGHGVHAYWPLDALLPPDEWKRYALGLKRLADRLELRVDAQRAADIASVLRTPGTFNRKRLPPAPVECGPLTEKYDIRFFERLLDADQVLVPRRTSPASASRGEGEALLGGLGERLAASISAALSRPSYAAPIAERCAQVRLLRDSGGNLPEPQWYAALGVLAFCVDGDDAAHRWSSGYAGYAAEETAERLARARTLSGATLCDRFSHLDSARCVGCPFFGKINSPISLGYDDGDAVADRSLPLGPGVGAPARTAVLDLPQLPDTFLWGPNNELVCRNENAKGGAVDEVISRHPLYLASIQRAEVQTDSFSYNFRCFLPMEGWIDIALPAKRLMGSDGVAEMFSRGAAIRDRELFRHYVVAAVDAFNAKERLMTKYEQFGWKDDDRSFLWGRRLYTPDAIETVIGSDEVKTRAQFLQPRPGGSLERWSNAADKLFSVDCEPHAFALLCAFAAPLMRFHSTDEGGALVSLVSPESGSGKSTALAAVASVWGKYDGLSLNNFDTRVSKGITLGVLGNLPAVYDEIAHRDPEVLKEFVLTFTNGRDRMRGTTDGTIRHTAQRWQTILVTAANRSIVELIRGADTTDAPGFRILEFPTQLPPGLAKSVGDDLKHELELNAGYAGEAYLDYITAPEANLWLRAAVKSHTDAIWQRGKFNHEHRFWIRTIGSVSAAAAVVQKLGLVSFSPERIIKWVLEHITSGKEESTVTGRVASTAVSVLSEYLNDSLADTLVVDRAFRAHAKAFIQAKPTRKLTIRHETDTRRYMIAERPFRDWLKHRNIPGQQLIDDLKKADIVTRTRMSATLSAGTEIPGGQINCIEVNGGHPALSGQLAEVRMEKAG